MLLMLAISLMVAARSYSEVSANRSHTTTPVTSRRRRLPVFALGLALALVSLPGAAWAHAVGSQGAAQVDPSLPLTAPAETATAINPTTGRTTQATEYAAREASAKGLENFKGGDTTVVIGGSALVIIIVVILILILI